MTARQLEGGIAAQMIEVVGIFVAAGDGKNTSAQNVRKRVYNSARFAPIDDLRSKPIGDSHAPFGQRQQQHTTVEGGGDLLASNRWQRKRQQAIVDHGGCGSVRLGKRLASAPKSLCQFSRLHYIRQRIPAL